MSPLEAARIIAEQPQDACQGYIGGNCFYCGMSLAVDDAVVHRLDCPVPVIPRIVVALETCEHVLTAFLRGSYLDDDGMPTAWFCENCGGWGRTHDAVEHDATCRIGLMVAALRGEGVAV